MKEKGSILIEHNKISNARYILATVNFLAILIGTLVTLFFASKKGMSDTIRVFSYILLALNSAQLVICLVDWITKKAFGIYISWLIYVSWAIGAIWVIVAGLEVYFSYLALGFLRYDLLAIFIIQTLTAILAYLIWPSLERSAINKLISQKVRGDEKLRQKSSVRFVVMYVVLSVMIVMTQAGALISYKIPPVIYDLFDESRALQYELNEAGDGYIVTGVYTGTSSVVNVPATYNGLPVKGIAPYALSDDTLLGQYAVKTITFGSREIVDGEECLVSNLEYMYENAIVNDTVETLELPASITYLADNAINGRALKTITYQCKAGFEVSYFNCSSLQKIIISGDEVGRIESLENMQEGLTIEVKKEDYNTYRQNNILYAESIAPALGENEICLDFYTNCDYYIPSIISTRAEGISIDYKDLRNTADMSQGLVTDTKAYIDNKKEVGTAGIKADSAFRGWYTDSDFTREFNFGEEKIVLTESLSIYAKWIDEYTGSLDWGTFEPDDGAKTLYWTNEDPIKFPLITDLKDADGSKGRKGYDVIEWYLDGEVRKESNGIERNVQLEAKWILSKPTIDVNPLTGNGDGYTISLDRNEVGFTYDEGRVLKLSAEYSHPLATTFSYRWTKEGDASFLNRESQIKVQDVKDAGKYYLEVSAMAPLGEVSVATTEIIIEIERKALNISKTAYLLGDTQEYNSENHHLAYTGDFGENTNIAVSYEYRKDGELVGNNAGVSQAGTYEVKAIFYKNDTQEEANYKTESLTATLTITKKTLVCGEWQIDGLAGTSCTYDGSEHTLTNAFSGIEGGDSVHLTYRNGENVQKNAGTYTVIVSGVDNDNYQLWNGAKQASLTIEKRPVYVKEWKLDGNTQNGSSTVYDGNVHSVSAVMDGQVFGENVEFIYASQTDYCSQATAAGTYTACVVGVNDGNYTFAEMANKEFGWKISKRELTISYNNPTLVYNGSSQGIVATIGNFAQSDANSVNKDLFLHDGASGVTITGAVSGNNYTLLFEGTRAGDYVAAISGVNNSGVMANYSLTVKQSAFTIEKKTLTFTAPTVDYIYNGEEQEFEIRVQGLATSEVGTVNENMFDISGLTLNKVTNDGNACSLWFSGKDFGDYIATIDGLNDENYQLGLGNTKTFHVAKKALTISSWEVRSNANNEVVAQFASGIDNFGKVTYNYSGYTLTPVVTGIQGDDAVVVNLSTGGIDEREVGTNYTATATLDAETYSNYTMATTNVTWNISPCVVEVSWLDSFGARVESGCRYTYSAAEITIEPSYALLGDDTGTLNYIANESANTNVGDYSIAISNIDNANYVIAEDTQRFDWTIVRKEVSVAWATATAEQEYNGTYYGPTFEVAGIEAADIAVAGVKLNLLAQGDRVGSINKAIAAVEEGAYALVGNDYGMMVDADTYTVKVLSLSGTKASNYMLTEDVGKTVRIHKKTVAFSENWTYENEGVNGVYGLTTLTYNNKNYVLTTAIDENSLVNRLDASVKDDVKPVYSNNAYRAAGTYEIFVRGLTGTGADNYALPETGTSVELTIQPKVLKLNWITSERTFTGSTQTQYAEILVGAADVDDGRAYSSDYVELYYEGNSESNAGTHTAKVTGCGNSNYTLDENTTSFEWVIKQKPVYLNWNNTTFTYNGNVQYPTASYYYNGITTYVTTYESTPVSKDAGDSYSITAAALDNENFTLVGGEALTTSYRIEKLPVSLSWNHSFADSSWALNDYSSFTYDGNTHTVTARITNKIESDTVNMTYTTNQYREVGTYTVSLTSLDNDNYTLNGSDNDVQFTIDKLALQFNWQETVDYTYSGSTYNVVATIANACVGDSVSISRYTSTRLTSYGTESSDNFHGTDQAGEYRVSVAEITGGDSNNYVISSGMSNTFTIAQQAVTIAWSGDTSVVYDGASHEISASVKGADDGKNVAFVYSGNNTGTSVGTYTASVVLNDTNYTTSSIVTSKSLTITKKTLGVIWGEDTFTYDGNVHTLTASVSGAASGDSSLSFIVSNATRTEAGEQTVTLTNISGTNASNYELPSVDTHTLTVKKAKIESTMVSWSGTNFTYNRENQNPTATVSVVSGNIINPVYTIKKSGSTVTSWKDAGTYTIQMSGFTGSSNYEMASTYASTSFTIAAKTVEIVWDASDTFTYDGLAHSLVASAAGVITGDTVSFTYSGNLLTNAGTKSVTISGLDNTNYSLPAENRTHTLTVNAAVCNISWETAGSYIYNGTTQRPTYTYESNGLAFVPTMTMTKNDVVTTSSVNVGTYKMTLTSNNSNIMLSGETEKEFTIQKATVTIAWTGEDTFVYDGRTHVPTYTATTNNGLTFNPTRLFTKDESTTASCVDAGVYKITLTSSDSNYELSGETEKEFTIQKATVTIAWTGEDTFVYDGRTHVPTYTVTTNNGLDVSSDLSLSIYRNDTLVTSALAVGEYCAKITLSNANYELLTTDFTFYIEASVE